jgi:predicted GNAT family acetyltransferase
MHGEGGINMSKENEVRDNKQEQRFEMNLGDGKKAFIQYAVVSDGVVDLIHTEVPEEFEGMGIGSKLVKATFDILQKENLQMIPTCRFVAVYLQRHPAYQSLTAAASE